MSLQKLCGVSVVTFAQNTNMKERWGFLPWICLVWSLHKSVFSPLMRFPWQLFRSSSWRRGMFLLTAWILPRLFQSGGINIGYKQTALTLPVTRATSSDIFRTPITTSSLCSFPCHPQRGGLETSHSQEEPLKATFGTSLWTCALHKSGKAAAFSSSVRRAHSSHKKQITQEEADPKESIIMSGSELSSGSIITCQLLGWSISLFGYKACLFPLSLLPSPNECTSSHSCR